LLRAFIAFLSIYFSEFGGEREILADHSCFLGPLFGAVSAVGGLANLRIYRWRKALWQVY